MRVPENLEPDTIWASRTERVYVLGVGKSRHIRSTKFYIDFFEPGIGIKWLELSTFLSRYKFYARPRIKLSAICTDLNVERPHQDSPRLLL